MSLIKLKIILQFKKVFTLLKRNFFLIAFGIILLIFTLIKWYFIFAYIIYLFYLFKKEKKILIFFLGISIIFLFSYYINLYWIKNEYKGYYESSNNFKGIVIDIKEYDNYNRYIVLNGFNKIVAIDNQKLNIEISDKIIFNGLVKEISVNKNLYEFNYSEYLLGERSATLVSIETISIKKSFNIFSIRKYLYRYVNYCFKDEANYYIKALLLGDNSNISELDKENIKINNISHLFAISGMHITLMVNMINKGLDILKLKEKKKNIIIISFLLIYMVITNLSPSVLRSGALYIFNVINKKKKLMLSSLDIISIIFLLFIIINPVFIYNLSFKLSFLASFFIIITSNIIKKIKDKYKLNTILELILLTFVLQVLSLPVIINLNNKINVTSIITNSFFIIYMTYVMLPLIIFTFFIPILKYPLGIIINIFSFFNNIASKYLTLNITLPSLSIIEVFLFYALITCFIYFLNCARIKKTKNIIYFIIIFLCFFFVYYNKSNLNYYTKMEFLALHEGEATIIDLPFNKGVIIIDTGTGENNALSNYLESRGIRKIDALILTHDHLDHNGEAIALCNKFNVKNVYISEFDESEINGIKLKKGDVFNVCDIDFKVYNPSKSNKDKNYESLVIGFSLEGLNYLFLGDAPKEIEKEIMNDVESVDIVKVGHHGSNTSTLKEFYQKINPKICIIMTGEIEYYHFPNYEVIETLKDYYVYRTDKDYEIILYIHNKKIKVKTLKE